MALVTAARNETVVTELARIVVYLVLGVTGFLDATTHCQGDVSRICDSLPIVSLLPYWFPLEPFFLGNVIFL